MSHEIETAEGGHVDPAHDPLQNGFAIGVGAVLVILGLIRLLYDGQILGVFSVSRTHGLLHMLLGATYLWAGVSRTAVARNFNNTLGIFLLVLSAIQFALVLFGFYSFAPDAILHLIVGVMSISMAQTDRMIPRKGVSVMEALNYPFAK